MFYSSGIEKYHNLIAGASGSGKSFAAGAIFEKLYLQKRPFVLFDTKQVNHLGLVELKNVKLLKIFPNKTYDFEKVLKNDYLVCIPDRKTKLSELLEKYLEFLQVIYEVRKPVTLGIEEAHIYCRGNFPGEELELLTRDGRGYGQNMIFITQRIQDFPKLLWSQCRTSYIFKSLIPQDIRYISQLVPEYPSINPTLKDHDFIRYHHNNSSYELVKGENVYRVTTHYG